MSITLYNRDLKETVEVQTEAQANVLAKSGWTTEVPKKYESEEKKEA